MTDTPIIKPPQERDNLDLLELVCQLHSRAIAYPSEEMHNAYLEAREELEKRLQPKEVDQNDWISVEDRLPENNMPVLFYLKNTIGTSSDIRKGLFLVQDQWKRPEVFCDGAFFHKSTVTHWRPLPLPPTKQKQ